MATIDDVSMHQRYPSQGNKSTLSEKRLWCERHQTHYGTHMWLGGRIALSNVYPVCNRERVEE